MVQARFLEAGMPPAEVADIVLDAIKDERFYVLTHPEMKQQIERRFRDILDDRNPEPVSGPGMLAGLFTRGDNQEAKA